MLRLATPYFYFTWLKARIRKENKTNENQEDYLHRLQWR